MIVSQEYSQTRSISNNFILVTHL